MAHAAYPQGAATAVLARAEEFPDALTASAVAGAAGGPILLTGSDALEPRTATALADLHVGDVILVGGLTALGGTVERQLDELGYAVTRLGGEDRYDTAAVTARFLADRIGVVEGRRTAFLTGGSSFADALVAGPAATSRVLPILLTAPDALPAVTAAALGDLALDHVVIVGGPAAVSDAVAAQVAAAGVSTTRVAGRDRSDTSAAFADFLATTLGLPVAAVLLVRGDAFPDALAAAPYASTAGAPVLLSRDPATVSYDVLQWTVDHAERIGRAVAVGGPAAVSDHVLSRVADAAVPPRADHTYTVGSRGPVAANLADFAEHVDWTLTDERGWSLGNDVRWTRAPSGTMRVWLATPQEVAAASPGCSAEWSCRVGNDVFINEARWRQGTATYAGHPLDDYHHYVVNHEVGHWIGLGHVNCPGAGQPAAVMQQQSKALSGCTTNVWPLPSELDQARRALAATRALTAAPDVVTLE